MSQKPNMEHDAEYYWLLLRSVVDRYKSEKRHDGKKFTKHLNISVNVLSIKHYSRQLILSKRDER